MPYPYITSSKDLFDYEGCVIHKLVENNMTNKLMGPKLLEKDIILHSNSHKAN